MGRGWLLVVLVALAGPADAAPGDTQASAHSELYVYLGGFDRAPMHPQRPSVDLTSHQDGGVLAASTGCVPADIPFPRHYHTVWAYATPWPPERSDVGRLHGEDWGLGYDARLDLTRPILLHWYLFTKGPGETPANAAPLAIPDVAVQATLRARPVDAYAPEAYDQGDLVAEGRATATLAGSQTQASAGNVTYLGLADGRHVYHYEVLLEPVSGNATLPVSGYTVRVDVLLEVDGCKDPAEGYLMPNVIGMRSSHRDRPRLEMHVHEPLRTQAFSAFRVADDLVLSADLQSVWGLADVANVTVEIDGPTRPHVELLAMNPYSTHVGLGQPLRVEWVWNLARHPPADGTYTATVRFSNLQGTAWQEQTAAHTFGEAAEAGAGPVAATVLGLAALVAVLGRRPRGPS